MTTEGLFKELNHEGIACLIGVTAHAIVILLGMDHECMGVCLVLIAIATTIVLDYIEREEGLITWSFLYIRMASLLFVHYLVICITKLLAYYLKDENGKLMDWRTNIYSTKAFFIWSILHWQDFFVMISIFRFAFYGILLAIKLHWAISKRIAASRFIHFY